MAAPLIPAWCLPTRRRVERILILGATPFAGELVSEIERRPDARCVVVGVLDDETPPDATMSGLFLGPLSRVQAVVNELEPTRIVMALRDRRGSTPIAGLLDAYISRGVIVDDVCSFYEHLTGRVALESLTPIQIITSGRFQPSRVQQAFARILSMSVAVVALVALLPVLAVIAIAIRLDSPGPVLFVQERVGAGGRPFALLKFRTMQDGRPRRSEWEGDNQDHVTRAGKWLRRFRLDELPQFINVLRGEMNLVGPRPHPVTNFELFTLVARNLNVLTGAAIGCYGLRLLVRPGLTGWAQVRYRYANNLEEEIEKLRYDLYYVKYFSTWFDLRILVDTLGVVLKGRPADEACPADEAFPDGVHADARAATSVVRARSFGFARKVNGTTEA